MRPAVFVPDSKPLDALLREMQRDRNHMALLVDEYGAIAGLVTIEDVLEEIVGEIADEYDTDEVAPVEDLGDKRFRVSARLPIEDLGELYDIEFDEDLDVDTVGGLLALELGRVPLPGAEVTWDGLRLRAEGGRDHRGRVRIGTVLVSPHRARAEGTTMTELDAEDAKLVVLARGAMGRAEAGSGAAVRDLDGRTYAGAPVALDALTLTALQAAVAAAVSSGATGLEAAVLVGGSADDAGVAAVRELSARRRRSSSPTASGTVRDDAPRVAKRIPFRLRLFRRPAEHRQVDADQRAGRRQGGDHVEPAADHPAHHPRHRAPRRLPDRPRRHPGPAPAAHAAGQAAQRPGDATPTPRSTSSGCASPPTRRSAQGTGGSTSRSAPSRRRPRWWSIVTKIDKVSKERVAAQLMAVSELVGPDTPRSCRCRRPRASRSTC